MMTAHMDEPQARRPGTGRRFFAHLRGRWRRPQTLHIYDFEEVPALMDGAGSSAVVAWQAQTSNATLALVSALIASVASVLTGVVTFLDLGGRAERHRKAAADYKGALRQLEATSFKPTRLDPAAEAGIRPDQPAADHPEGHRRLGADTAAADRRARRQDGRGIALFGLRRPPESTSAISSRGVMAFSWR